MNLDYFYNGYIECALWSSTDHSDESGGEPLDANYSEDDLAPQTAAKMRADCADFIKAHEADLDASGLTAARAGHDFWLTRNGHGSGFWDEGLGELGDRLTKASKFYGSFDLYVGDDGKIYA